MHGLLQKRRKMSQRTTLCQKSTVIKQDTRSNESDAQCSIGAVMPLLRGAIHKYHTVSTVVSLVRFEFLSATCIHKCVLSATESFPEESFPSHLLVSCKSHLFHLAYICLPSFDFSSAPFLSPTNYLGVLSQFQLWVYVLRKG